MNLKLSFLFVFCCLSSFFFFSLTSVGVDSTGEDIHSLLINNCLPLRAPPVLGAAVLNGLPPRLPAAGADSRRRLRRRGEHITLDYVALCLPAAAADCFSDAVAVTLPFSPKSFCLFFSLLLLLLVCFAHRSARCSETRSSLQCGSRWGWGEASAPGGAVRGHQPRRIKLINLDIGLEKWKAWQVAKSNVTSLPAGCGCSSAPWPSPSQLCW